MARTRTTGGRRDAEDYRHDEAQRLNNPLAGLARYETDKTSKRRFEYDPHLPPELLWAGKAERTSFEVDAVSIHVHEALSTQAIARTLRKERPQIEFFGDPQLDRNREIEFYQHEVGWRNRLILGDSLVVMTSLLERERMGGQVHCIYFDPPYGINYNSNFQARVSNRTPKETDDDAITREPEQIQAFRDTWALGVHSYLTYMRDRLLLARDMLADGGSIFVQIGQENMHRVRLLLDEVFGPDNACAIITVAKTSGQLSRLLPDIADYVLWYARNKSNVRFFQLYEDKREEFLGNVDYRRVEEPDGTRRTMTPEERANPRELVERGCRVFRFDNLTSPGYSPHKTVPFVYEGRTFHPGENNHWKLRVEGLEGLARARRLGVMGNTLAYVRYADEGGLVRHSCIWTDTSQPGARGRRKQYVVETNSKIVERCVLMTSQPGDLVLDPTCGSGTTAFVAEKHGRRWITCDTSRVALTLARERLLTAVFPYYRLLDHVRGVDAGIRYEKRPWIKASSIGYGDEDFDEIVLYDQPEVDAGRVRVSGPFTVEGLSRCAVNPLELNHPPDPGEDNPAAGHIDALLDALRSRGIPIKGRSPLKITSLTRLASTTPLHAEGTTDDGQTFAVSIGPEFGPITVQQVDEAIADAAGYPLVVFAGFTATAEAQSFLARGHVGRHNVVLLEANADLLIGDLLKNTSSSQTFRLFSAPDAEARPALEADASIEVELMGIDVFDVTIGEARQQSLSDVAAWFLDHDYDGEVFHICQAFFPKSQGWEALGRALRGSLDDGALARTQTFVSNPFAPGEYRRAAIRVIDDSGQTSEATIDLAQLAAPH